MVLLNRKGVPEFLEAVHSVHRARWVGKPEEHTYTEIVDAIRVHGADAQADIEELWRRIALSILITNVDDHLRNQGFLHIDREFWRLSPAFDINPSPERVRELKTWIYERAFMKDRELKKKETGEMQFHEPSWGTPWHLSKLSPADIEAELEEVSTNV